MKYPVSLEKLIECFKMLPGIGEKNAERLSFAVLKFDDEQTKNFSESIKNIKERIKKCKICNNLTEEDICDICKDKNRNSEKEYENKVRQFVKEYMQKASTKK